MLRGLLTEVECATFKLFVVETNPFSTMIHLRTHVHGLPIGLTLTPGEAHDSTAYAELMDERDSDPGLLLGSALSTPPKRSVSLKKGAGPTQGHRRLLRLIHRNRG